MLLKRLRNNLHVPTPGQSSPFFIACLGVSILVTPGVTVAHMTANHPNIYNATVVGLLLIFGAVFLALARKTALAIWIGNIGFILQALATVQYALETGAGVQGAIVYLYCLWNTYSYVHHLSSLTGRYRKRDG